MKSVKVELAFAGKIGGRVVFTRRANDGMYYVTPDGEHMSKLVEAGVYEMEFTPDNATPDVDSTGALKRLLISGFVKESPKFLRSLSGKPTHFEIIERFKTLEPWFDSIEE